MAGRFGNVAASISQGFQQGSQIVQKEQADKSARIKGLQAQASSNAKQLQEVISQFVENARQKGTTDTPGFQQGIEVLKGQLLRPGDLLTQQGIASTTPRETLISFVDNLIQQPTVAQEQAVAATGAATTARAVKEVGEEFKPEPTPSVQNFEFRDGSPGLSIDMTAPGAQQAVADALTKGGFRVGFEVGAQKVSDLIPDKAMTALNEAEISLRGVLGETSRLREQVSTGSFTGFAGGMIIGLNSLAGNVAQASRALTGTDDSALRDPSKYDFRVFGPEAERSAALRSNVTNLAYVLARSADPGGRISDADVRHQITRLSAGAGDPSQLVASLDEVDRSAKDAFRNRHLVTARGVDVPLPGDLFPPEAGSVLDQLKAKPIEEITPEEFSQLDEAGQAELLKHHGFQ